MNKKKIKNIQTFYRIEESGNNIIVHFSGDFIISNASYYNQVDFKTLIKKHKNFVLIFGEINSYDSFFVSYLNSLKKLFEKNNINYEILGIKPEIESFYNYLTNLNKSSGIVHVSDEKYFIKYMEKLGKIFSKLLSDGYDFISFIGEVILGFIKIFISPKKIRWVDLPDHILQIGVNAVPISLLIVFLLGLVTGYQGALQLKLFGADIYIADLIGVSLTRELAPLMVAIIIAGRSGSAFTAEIGTMKLSEEIDALKVMGFNITDFIVMPRLIASLIAVPIIVMLADIAGILGGLLATLTTLDLTSVAYFNRMQEALLMNDVFSGLIKAEIFAFFIAIIGCFRGMQVSGGAESVGRYTTSSVVTSIFHIIVIDSVFTLIFPILGI